MFFLLHWKQCVYRLTGFILSILGSTSRHTQKTVLDYKLKYKF